MKLNDRVKALLLVLVVLGIYYPAIFAGVNSVDDWRMLVHLENAEKFDLKHVFLPGSGFYYRPLLFLSFIADKYLWNLDPSFMHLENILLHVLNTLLVFFLARRVFSRFAAGNSLLPLLSALVFALHPINTEPVNWISGRTDPLATVFVLLSAFVMIKGLEENRKSWLLASALLLFVGAMAKEVAVFFFPAACLIVWFWPAGNGTCQASFRTRIQEIGLFSIPFVLGGGLYLLLRHKAFSFGDKGIWKMAEANLPSLFFDSLKAFGFYIKKLFIPVPLNFAILEVSDIYIGVGTLALAVTIWLLFRRKNTFICLLAVSFLLISPAIVVALFDIAWTPFAERYLYLPSAFFAIAVTGLCWQVLGMVRQELVTVMVVCLVLLPAAVFTGQRNLVWQDNARLYRDTLEKSPNFANLHNELAIALVQQGKGAEAERELLKGQELTKKNVLLFVNLAGIKLHEGKTEEAREILLQAMTDKGSCNSEVLRMLARVDEKRLTTTLDVESRRAILEDLIETYEVSWRRSGDSFFIYRCAQLVLFSGDKQKAAGYFARAHAAAPSGAHYKEAAGKLAARLKAE